MSEADRERWDGRYAEGQYRARVWPSELLVEWLPRLPRGRALDVACGAGRNALHLAAGGFAVDGVDISDVALGRARAAAAERGLDATFHCMDLDAHELPGAGYDLVIVSRFVDRGLVPALRAALAPDGFLLYDHHLRTHRDVAGPKSPEFRVGPNELLSLFEGLRVVHYHEGIVVERDGREMALAQLVACNGDPGF